MDQENPFPYYVPGNAVPSGHVWEAVNFLKGLALQWYNKWLNEPGEHIWEELVNGLHSHFGKTHSAIAIAQMWENLKQKGSVDKY